jgi:hypothetical protein
MRLVGDTSYGAGCAEPGFPGVYGRLAGATLREWIRSIAPKAISSGSASSKSRLELGELSRTSSPPRTYR